MVCHRFLKELHEISLPLETRLFGYQTDLSRHYTTQILSSSNLLLYTACLPACVLTDRTSLLEGDTAASIFVIQSSSRQRTGLCEKAGRYQSEALNTELRNDISFTLFLSYSTTELLHQTPCPNQPKRNHPGEHICSI